MKDLKFPMVVTQEISDFIVKEVLKRSKYVQYVGQNCSNGQHFGGPEYKLRAINQFWLCQNEKESWPYGYLENSNYVRFWLINDGTLKVPSYGCKLINKEKEKNTPWQYCAAKGYNNIYKNFRQCKVKNVEQAIQKMVDYFDTMWEVVKLY